MPKILAVDDEAHALKILRLHLTEAGYEVFCAASGEEALALLAQHPDMDCVLLDRMMPGIDGMEVLRRMKEKGSPYRHISVILQTAKREDWDAYEGTDAGAVNYLVKPYVRETLLAAVEAVMRDRDALKAYLLKQAKH